MPNPWKSRPPSTRTLARQSTVSEVVARLVRRGLVTRRPNPGDARQVTLQLTARGRRAIARPEPTAQERLLEGLGDLSAGQRTTLAEALEGWLAASDLTAIPATMFFEAAHPPEGGR